MRVVRTDIFNPNSKRATALCLALQIVKYRLKTLPPGFLRPSKDDFKRCVVAGVLMRKELAGW